MRLILSLLATFLLIAASGVRAESQADRKALIEKIVQQGAPLPAVEKVYSFLDQNKGAKFVVDAYHCDNGPKSSEKLCKDIYKRVKVKTKATKGKKAKIKWRQQLVKRVQLIKSSKEVVVKEHKYAVIVDFSRPSTQKRLFLIEVKTGKVKQYLVTHGKGSGHSLMADRFSNIMNSKQTSLGMYITGGAISSSHGPALRLYGVEKSNDQAYVRDIIMHGAPYAGASFLNRLPRLGVSWGCPALGMKEAKEVMNLIKGGALVYHYHPELQEVAMSGLEVRTQASIDKEAGGENVLMPDGEPEIATPDASDEDDQVEVTIEGLY